MKSLQILLLLQFTLCLNSFGQLDTSDNLKPILQDFFQSKSVVDFMQVKNDTTINIIDADNSLSKFEIIKWGDKFLNIITKGKEVDEVKKYSFLGYGSNIKNLYIFSYNQIDYVACYRIFHPITNADCHIVILSLSTRTITILS